MALGHQRLVQFNGFCCINRAATAAAATFVMRLRSIAGKKKKQKMASIVDNVFGTAKIVQKAMNIYGRPLQHPKNVGLAKAVDHSIAQSLQKESQQKQTHITIIDTNNKDS